MRYGTKAMLLGSTRFYRTRDDNIGGGGDTGGTGGQSSQPLPQNNGGGNNADQGGTNGGTQNNTGASFDPAKFWADPNGGNGNGSGGGSGTQTPNHEEIGKQFTQQLTGMKFGDVFTPDVAKQVAEGNLTGLNDAIGQQLRGAVQNSVVMTAQLMKHNNEIMLNQVAQLLDSRLGARDNTAALEEHFPSAKDPAIRPMVENVFNQALKLSKGDRNAAIEATRNMLKYMGSTAQADLGIDLSQAAPTGADSFNSPASKSLLDSLLGRS